MTTIRLKELTKIFNENVIALNNINLQVTGKNLISVVGPSGSGKTTLLKVIAGLEEVSSGEIFINEQLVNSLSPKERGIGIVFSNYELSPELKVYDNLAFGLELCKHSKDEIDSRIRCVALTLGFEPYLDIKTLELSKQLLLRVLLGRACLEYPKFLLLDHSLPYYDFGIKQDIQEIIIKIKSQFNTTTIHSTENPSEVMNLDTQLVVIKDGHIQQVGTPNDVYYLPNNIFIGGYIGYPSMPSLNYIDGFIHSNKFVAGEAHLVLPESIIKILNDVGYDGKQIVLGIRQEDLESEERYINKCRKLVKFTFNERYLLAISKPNNKLTSGENIEMTFDINKIYFFDKESEKRIYPLDINNE